MQAALALVLIVAAVANAGLIMTPTLVASHPVAYATVPVASSSVYKIRAPAAKVITPVAVAHPVTYAHAPVIAHAMPVLHHAPAPLVLG